MHANQVEATKHQGKSIIHALPTAGLTQNGVHGGFILALIYNLAERQTQTYTHYSSMEFTFKSLFSSQRGAAATYVCKCSAGHPVKVCEQSQRHCLHLLSWFYRLYFVLSGSICWVVELSMPGTSSLVCPSVSALSQLLWAVIVRIDFLFPYILTVIIVRLL